MKNLQIAPPPNFNRIGVLCVGLFCFLAAATPVNAVIEDYTGGALKGYQLVYELNIPATGPGYATKEPDYAVNNSASLGGIVESIGYYLVLDKNWVFTSMDAFTNDLKKIGVPTSGSGAIYQQYVGNLYYKSNVASLKATEGKQVDQGNIEFWPTDYSAVNASNIPEANGSVFDFGDSRSTSGTFGSMQVHDYQNQTTIFAFNSWGAAGEGRVPNLGIGNNTSGHPDWTHRQNARDYTNRQLGVYVKTLNFDAVAGPTQREIITSETANMELIYKYDIGANRAATTLIDNSSNTNSSMQGMPLKRTGYYYELTDQNGNKTYAYASFDALTNNRAQTGLPGTYTYTDSNSQQQLSTYYHQTKVNNMTVQSNVEGVTNGTGIQTGNVEIWGSNYSHGNSNGVPGASDNIYDFGDQATPGGYGSFQIHNYGDDKVDGHTVIALNQWTSPKACVGIGNNPNPSTNSKGPQKDWTFADNVSNYTDVKLYVMAEAAIAPGMANAINGSEYTVVQGAKLTSQMTSNWHNGNLKYDIVDNLATMQSNGKLSNGKVFDRVGYYIEYAATEDSPLYYAFVSMDAFTDDLSKIGVPTEGSGITYQQTVKNLEVSSNVVASEGILTTGSFKNGYLEFWSTNYGAGKGNVISQGSGAIFDINDTPNNVTSGHGSMQVHNLDTEETVFAVNGFNQTKQYGIGNNPEGSTTTSSGNTSQKDWTFDSSKSGYKIANIYTFIRESDAVLTTLDAASGIDFYQRDRETQTASVDIGGNFKAADGVSIAKIQASADGTNWIDLAIDATGSSYNGSIDLPGGWHYVNVRALDSSNQILTSTTTGKIGVGEIFITAGQSNSTNCGDSTMPTTTGDVVALNLATGNWQIANDPQPTTINGQSDGSSHGSTWPAFGDALSEMLGVPIGVVSVGWSGSSIGQWDPANVDTTADGWVDIAFRRNDSNLFGRLAYAIQELEGNVAGILWHQGESNAGSPQEYYQQMLESLVNASWEEADWDIPWLVALVSRNGFSNDNKTGVLHQQIRDAQLAVIDEYAQVYLGPDSDALIGALRGQNSNNGIHFSVEGLQRLGELWALSAGREIYGLPEPGTWAMMLLGMAVLVWSRRKSLLAKISS